MEGQELKEGIEEASKQYAKSREEYRNHVLKYATTLLAGELTVVGFLLQSKVTSPLFSKYGNKYILLASVYSCGASVVLAVIARRLSLGYWQNIYGSWYYKLLSKLDIVDANVDGQKLNHVDDGAQKSESAHIKGWKQSMRSDKVYLMSERALGISAILAAIFVTLLLIAS